MVIARRTLDSLNEEYEITSLDPKEAHARFVAKVNEHKQAASRMEEKIVSSKGEVKGLRKTLEDLTVAASSAEEKGDDSENAKYELLVKREQEMSAFVDGFDEVSTRVLMSLACDKNQ